MSKTIWTSKSVNLINHQQKKNPSSFFFISLFTCPDEQSTDEDTSDENSQILDEMSQTLENLLRENSSTFISNEVKSFLIIYKNLFFVFTF